MVLRFRERVLAALGDRVVRGRGEHTAALAGAAELRMKADYSQEDLTEAGRSLRAQVAPVLEFCRKLVDTAAGGG